MRIGFIGCGNMGTAMLKGILKAGVFDPQDLTASAISMETKNKIQNELKIRLAESNRDAAEFADILFLAVKPKYYEQVIKEIRDIVRREQIIVSIAPGKTLQWMREMFQKPVKLVYATPNTPAMVLAGMTAFCVNELVTEEEKNQTAQICSYFGEVEETEESLMNAVISVSGSAPAYIFMFIEAMADAAVAEGMPRAKAYKFASQAVLGSAKMVQETGLHPGELKDMVCSPGGTTIQAVRVLEEKGMRSSVFEAMRACAEKAGRMQ